MSRIKIAKEISDETGFSVKDIYEVVSRVFKKIPEMALKSKKGKVQITEFGTFFVDQRKGYERKNYLDKKNGGIAITRPKTVLRFKEFKNLKGFDYQD